MFTSYMYPRIGRPFMYQPGWGYPTWAVGGYGYNYGYGGNVLNSAIAVQNMNTIGVGAIGGTQNATPTVIW